MKILIIEDELLISEMLKEIVLELGHTVSAQAKTFELAIEQLDLVSVDIVICDINLNQDKSGIDIARLLHTKYDIPFIFLTSYSDEKTLKLAAETEPLAYLIKPFQKSDIHATLLMIESKVMNRDKHIIIKDGNVKIKLTPKEVNFIKSENNYIEIHTDTKRHVVRTSLDGIINDLGCSNIIRTHRSFAVHLSKIKAIKGSTILLENDKIPLSRKYKTLVVSRFYK